MRFLSLSDSSEVLYDSCLPDYFDVINLESTDSGYKYRGQDVLRYEGNSDLVYETGTTLLSAVKQFPFEGNPKRRLQKTAAIVSVADSGFNDIMSDPFDFTGVSLDPLDTAFLTRFAFVSKAPGVTKPNYGEAFIPANDPDGGVYDLSTCLSSSYFFTGSLAGTLFDVSGNAKDLDLTPTFTDTHPPPTESADVPVSNLLSDGSLSFPVATSSGAVSLAAATTAITQHRMISGIGLDAAFTLSITFKLAALGSNRVLIERSLWTGAARRIEYTVFLDTQNRVHFRIYEDGSTTYKGKYTGLLSISTGWTNVTVTYDGVKTETTGAGMKIFIKGTERTATDESSGHTGGQMYNDTNSRILVGAGRQISANAPDETTEFNGLIHALHIWKGRALTSSEVAALSRAELSGLSNGIIKHRADFGLLRYDGPLRRGTYRYGISNINQESTTSVFNSSHFGHARDTLEQRKDTTFTDVKPPVACSFFSGSQRVDPTVTNSQNLSSFATSSLPYFDDGIARNRDDDFLVI